MSEIDRIQDQLKRAHEGGAWHGPSLQEILKGISASEASARPVPNAHSIWEIVLHIAAWEGAGRRRLQGDRAQLPREEDWPRISDTSDGAWQHALTKLDESYRLLRDEISRLKEDRLDQPVLSGMSSVYVTLHGVIQHDLYHAAQIAILKKALLEERRA